MADKTATIGAQTLRTGDFSKGWNLSANTQDLSDDLLSVPSQFHLLDKTKKLCALFSMLHIRKGEFPAKRGNMMKILELACKDDDEWVRMVGHILKDFPSTQKFDTHIEHWCDSFKPLLDQIGQSVKTTGTHFHPKEYMLLQPNAIPSCPHGSTVFNSGKPTLTKHFTLSKNPDAISSSQQRMKRFEALLEQESRAASGSADAMDIDQPSAMAQPSGPISPTQTTRPRPPQRSNSGTNSMFIQRHPARRPVVSKPSFLRPTNNVRFTPTGAVRPPGVHPPTTPGIDSKTPKGLIKHSRVQMLDFDDANMFQESNAREIDKAQQELQKQEELRRMRAAEERKREREHKRRRKTSTTSLDETNKGDQPSPVSPTTPTATTPTSVTEATPSTQLNASSETTSVTQPMPPSDPNVA